MRSNAPPIDVLIPLNSGQLLCPAGTPAARAVLVLIPLNSGQLLCQPVGCLSLSITLVLIPLNSGQLLCPATVQQWSNGQCLNPFEFRAVTLSHGQTMTVYPDSLNPFEFRAVTLSTKSGKVVTRHCLNPFEFRAVTLSRGDSRLQGGQLS